jgi:hypothetical protein
MGAMGEGTWRSVPEKLPGLIKAEAAKKAEAEKKPAKKS